MNWWGMPFSSALHLLQSAGHFGDQGRAFVDEAGVNLHHIRTGFDFGDGVINRGQIPITLGCITPPATPKATATLPDTSDRTLAFVYGPEHQRVKQTVTLTHNAPTNMMGGTTW